MRLRIFLAVIFLSSVGLAGARLLRQRPAVPPMAAEPTDDRYRVDTTPQAADLPPLPDLAPPDVAQFPLIRDRDQEVAHALAAR